MTNLEESLRQFLRTNFYLPSGAPLPADASLRDLGVVDSTGVLELVSYLEQEHGIRIDDSELLPENLDSVEAILGFVQRKREGRP